METKLDQILLTLSAEGPITNDVFSNEANKVAQEIIAIATKFEQHPDHDVLSQKDKVTIQQKLFNLSKKDLQGIQRALKQYGICISTPIEDMISPKTRAFAVVEVIEARKKPQITDELSPPVGRVTCSYFERPNYNYFSVTPKGDVVCLVPFISCNEINISSENTCKTGETMKAALLATTQNPLILETLATYLSDLINDFNLLGILNSEQIKDIGGLSNYLAIQLNEVAAPILQGKIKRYLQLKQYQGILEQIVADPALKNDLSSYDMSEVKLPQPVRTALEKSNAVSFLIAPQMKAADSYLRLTSATLFSLQRPYIGLAGQTYPNPKYPTGFVEALKSSLESRSQNLQQKLQPSGILTKEVLLSQINKEYLTLTKIKVTDGEDIPLRDANDITRLRTAVLNVVKTLKLPDYNNFKTLVEEPSFFNKLTEKSVPDSHLLNYITDICFLDATVADCLPFILSNDQQEELTKQPDRSPFDEPTVTTPAQYNELIQIFLASACFGYYEFTNSQGTPERIDFGQRIENDDEEIPVVKAKGPKWFQFKGKGSSQKKQVSLITTIEDAIATKSSLEDAMLHWLETHILSTKQNTTFTPETTQRIKKLFKNQWQLFYPDAPHLDEFLIATANRAECPQVVAYRNTMALPLDVFCENYTGKPWLINKFNVSAHQVPLPTAPQLALESDLVTISPSSTVITSFPPCEIDVMSVLNQLMQQTPLDVPRFLLHKTTEGKSIYSLLNLAEVKTLTSHLSWAEVSKSVLELLSTTEAEQFKTKFNLKTSIHLTREHEHALYADYGMTKSLGALVSGSLTREQIIREIIGKHHKLSLNQITKTASSTYILEFNSQDAVDKIKSIYEKNKIHLHITPDMARSLYVQVGESGSNINLDQAASRFTDPPHSNNIDPHSNKLLPSSKLPLALKVLFPDLVIVIKGDKMPDDKTIDSPDVIMLAFNPQSSRYGYQVTSSNFDNLQRIRDYYESSITRILPGLEAGKILQAAADKQAAPQPIQLNTETLEAALDQLGIIYTSVVKVGLTYQIVCDSRQWEKLKRVKQKIREVDSKVVDLCREVINPETVDEFFTAIKQINIEKAKRLLSEYPGLLNTKDKEFQSTPLISALTLASNTNDKQRKLLLGFCSDLIEQPGIEIVHTDKRKNTALHRSICYSHRFASPPYPQLSVSDQFDKISLALWEKARQEDTQLYFLTEINDLNESIYGDKGSFDPQNRVKQQFAKHTFWNLLTETRYYNFQPALSYLFCEIKNNKKYADGFLNQLINTEHHKTNKFPLQMAIELGDLRVVEELISAGANVNQPFKTTGDELARSPLGLAIALSYNSNNPDLAIKCKEIVPLLISKKADLKVVKETMDEFHQQRTELTTEVDRIQEQMKTQQRQLVELMAENKEFKKLLSAEHPQVAAQLEEKAFFTKKNSALEEECTLLQKTHEDLQRQQKQQMEENQKLEQVINNQIPKVQQLSKDIQQIQQDLLAGQQKLQITQTEKEVLTKNLESKMEQNKQDLATSSILSQQNKELQVNLTEQQQTIGTLVEACQTKSAENNGLKKQLKEIREEGEDLQEQLNSQKKKNKEIEDQLKPEIEELEVADDQRAVHALSAHFFTRLQKIPAYQTLTSALRISKIEGRIDPKSLFQCDIKNENKAAALNTLKQMVDEKTATFDEVYTFIKENEKIITKSTRRDNSVFFRGEVTSARLFQVVKQAFQEEDKLIKEVNETLPPLVLL